jgi:hypothetical protein
MEEKIWINENTLYVVGRRKENKKEKSNVLGKLKKVQTILRPNN